MIVLANCDGTTFQTGISYCIKKDFHSKVLLKDNNDMIMSAHKKRMLLH